MKVRHHSEVAGVLLAGGRSVRMGTDKALLSIGGRPLIEHVLDRLDVLTDQIFISANDPSAYAFLGRPVIPDLYPGQGPLAGLHAAMSRSPRPLFLLVACDLPGVHEELLQRLILAARGFDAVIPRTSDGRAHPACAVYRRTLKDRLDLHLSRGINKATLLLEGSDCRVRWLTPEEGHFADEDLDNLNSPEDLERYMKS